MFNKLKQCTTFHFYWILHDLLTLLSKIQYFQSSLVTCSKSNLSIRCHYLMLLEVRVELWLFYWLHGNKVVPLLAALQNPPCTWSLKKKKKTDELNIILWKSILACPGIHGSSILDDTADNRNHRYQECISNIQKDDEFSGLQDISAFFQPLPGHIETTRGHAQVQTSGVTWKRLGKAKKTVWSPANAVKTVCSNQASF